jgi:hypothetical protein
VGTPEDVPPPPTPEDPNRCPRCGAPHDAYQEYCLECGVRLARYYPRSGGLWRRDVWTRDSPVWFWATFLALLLIALIAGAIVLAATDDDERQGARTRTAGPTTSTIAVIPTDITTGTLPGTVVIPTTPMTNTIPTLPTTTTADGGTPTTPTTTGTRSIISWPAGRDGYTIILASVPKTRGRGEAERRANEAIADNLPQVGILDSDDYTSLNAGYWVVFTGVYDTESQARGALPTARQAGWPIAYTREITPD